jgi:hypothetical protein
MAHGSILVAGVLVLAAGAMSMAAGMLAEHPVHDADERLVAVEQPVPARQQIAFKETLARADSSQLCGYDTRPRPENDLGTARPSHPVILSYTGSQGRRTAAPSKRPARRSTKASFACASL